MFSSKFKSGLGGCNIRSPVASVALRTLLLFSSIVDILFGAAWVLRPGETGLCLLSEWTS